MAPETVEIAVEVTAEAGGLVESDGVADGLVPLEVIERNLTSHAAHLAAAEAEWLGWLGEYCVRKGWQSWGCSGPVQWLSWQCGMSPSTAREKVRVALALRELSAIFAEFSAGRLSYSKVRALTRVATPTKDTELAELGRAATGAQLDVIVRARKQALDGDKCARSAWRERSWRSRADGEGSTVFTFRVPNDHADLVQRAVTAEVNQTIDDALGIGSDRSRADIIDSRSGWPAMAADAAVALLNGSARTDAVLPAEVEIVVNNDDHREHSAGADASVSATTNTPAEALNPQPAPANERDTDNQSSVSATTNTPAEAPDQPAIPVDTGDSDSMPSGADASVSATTNTPAEAPDQPAIPVDTGDSDSMPSGADASVSATTNTPAEAPDQPAIPVDSGDSDSLYADDDASVSATTNTPAEVLTAAVDHDFSLWGRSLASTVGHRLCCDPLIAVLIEDAKGSVLGAGRKTRLISRKLRRALERRDHGHCQFPGCGAQRRLHAHHIIHWSNGGPTEADNLILVCSFHHHALHEGGWNIDRLTRNFIKPDGTIVDATPTERFRGSAAAVTDHHWFDTPAPLAEAENEPYDLGLVLEGLAYDNTESQRQGQQCRKSYRPPVALGPPIPLDVHRERIVEAHRRRHANLYR